MKLKNFLLPIWWIFLSFMPGSLLSMEPEANGSKYCKNYRSSDYNKSSLNMAIAQDKQGIIYVVNGEGLLEFDGVSWRSYDIPNKFVRSLAIDDNGTLFIGGINEFGYMAPDDTGTLKYNSLIGHLQDKQKHFGAVEAIHVAKEGIYFQAQLGLFCWARGKLKVLKVYEAGKDIFRASFYCNGNLYICNSIFLSRDNTFIHSKLELVQVQNHSLKTVPGISEFLAIQISMMVPYSEKKLLLGTRSRGLFLFDGVNLEPFSTEVDSYLKEKNLSHGINLKSSAGQFALATRQGGVVIIDSTGRLKAVYNTDNILPENDVMHVFEDFQGNLWLVLSKGISKIEYTSPLTSFDEHSGLPGMVRATERHNGTLYVGTSHGLFYLAPDGKFVKIPGIFGPHSLLSTGKSLLAATGQGLFQVGEKSQEKIIKVPSYVFLKSQKEPRRVWVGTLDGLVSLFLKNERWCLEHKFAIKTDKIQLSQITSLAEDKDGRLWLILNRNELIIMDFPTPSNITNPIIQRFGKENRLPGSETKICLAAGHVMFATEAGLFRFDEQKRKFIPGPVSNPDYTIDSFPSSCLAEDNEGNIWIHSQLSNIEAIPGPDNTFTLYKKPFLRLPRVPADVIFPDPVGNAIWFGTDEGLYRYDKKLQKNYDLNFSAIIRKVLVNGQLVFGGDKSRQPHPNLAYYDGNFRFEFAAPFFEGESETRFRSFLQGYEKQWSEWLPETQKEYSNLSPGKYTFHVQAKNVYENLSSEAVFQFNILPPFYLRWWAFLVYAILIFFLVFFITKWRARNLEIQARNIEINEKNLQLESQTVQLKEQSIKLQEMDQIKSRFFANISHEFRTPLTLIMGPLEQMISACGADDKEEKRRLTMMLRNAQRLLRLINQLLELSKLDSGKMKLQAVKMGVISFLKGIIDSFRLLAYQHELDLVFEAEGMEEVSLFLDPRKMEDVMTNLLVNAFKFTPAGGKITVIIEQKLFWGGAGSPGQLGGGDFLEKSPPGCQGQDYIEISVCDTGPGIPEGDLPYIFDRFFQAESTYELYQKGTGIGLALARELVELHHGTIEARSREGEGCTFIVRLPMGCDHLSSDQIVELLPGQLKTQSTIQAIADDEITSLEESGHVALNDHEAEPGANESNIILVVEDSTDMCEYIRGALEPVYTVVDAKDGRQGIQKAQDIIPDLIISDIMMPKADGYELCRTLKSDVKTSHIPIILLTAKAAEENIIQGLETGADDYITKPFNTNILVARIKNLIDIRRQLQKNINREMSLQPIKTSLSSIDREFLKDLHEAIRKNLGDEDFNVEKLCKILYMNRTTLYRKVLALTGETPTDFIRSYRLKQGAELLKQNSGTVLEVALTVGFSNSSYFAKCFKEKFHQLPSEYQSASK